MIEENNILSQYIKTDVRSNTRETPIVKIYDSMQTDCFSQLMPITSKKRRIWEMPDPIL